MCKFHKDVAWDIATDASTGKLDPGKYYLARIALSKYSIEHYMPDMRDCGGDDNYEMASSIAKASLEKSGLQQPLADIQKYRDDNIGLLQEALTKTAAQHDLSASTLHLPKNAAKELDFMEEAAKLFDVRSPDNADTTFLKKTAHRADFEPIRAAVETFVNQPGVEAVLKKMIENAFVKSFTEAQKKANPTIVRLYDRFPGLRKTFNTCASCARDGGGGAFVSHMITCVILPASLGAVFSGAIMKGAMLVVSPLVAAGVGYGIDRLRGQKSSLAKLTGSAALAFGIACAYIGLGNHENHAGHHDGEVKEVVMSRQDSLYFNSLGGARQNDIVQNAKVLEMSIGAYMQDSLRSDRSMSWFKKLDPAQQDEVRRNAKMMNQGLGKALNGGCYDPIR